MLLKLKSSSSCILLSWSTRAMVIFSIDKPVLLILTLCIRSKIYGSRLSLRPRRKRLLSIQNATVFPMSEHLIAARLSESA